MSYVPLTQSEKGEMLRSIGASRTEDLFASIPKRALLTKALRIPPALSEMEVMRLMERLASLNRPGKALFLGAGAYRHFVPAAVDQLLLRGEFFTAYTPYQAEVSQGSLQAIYEYQTLICQLTGMDLANASVYDGATATAEAAVMACLITGRSEIAVSEAVHPHYREVLSTYGRGGRFSVRTIPVPEGKTDGAALAGALSEKTAALIVQSPNVFGVVEDLKALSEKSHASGALSVAVVCEATSLGILTPPGELGADIVAGEGQGFGNPLSFGGPHLGFLATKKEHTHSIPGRLVGQTVDSEGKRGYILTLQAREQHIRRERATSNICTSQQLNALACAIHLALVGPHLGHIAELNFQKAQYAMKALSAAGVRILFPTHPHYNEFVALVPDAAAVHKALAKKGIIAGVPLATFLKERPDLRDGLLLCVTEMNTREEIDALAEAIGKLAGGVRP